MTEELIHNLVPKHIKLSEKEKDELLKKYGVVVRQLPKISKKDPAIKHLDVQIGDVIKIMRSSETAKEAVFYRGVSDE